jgi:hypothetical protein
MNVKKKKKEKRKKKKEKKEIPTSSGVEALGRKLTSQPVLRMTKTRTYKRANTAMVDNVMMKMVAASISAAPFSLRFEGSSTLVSMMDEGRMCRQTPELGTMGNTARRQHNKQRRRYERGGRGAYRSFNGVERAIFQDAGTTGF